MRCWPSRRRARAAAIAPARSAAAGSARRAARAMRRAREAAARYAAGPPCVVSLAAAVGCRSHPPDAAPLQARAAPPRGCAAAMRAACGARALLLLALAAAHLVSCTGSGGIDALFQHASAPLVTSAARAAVATHAAVRGAAVAHVRAAMRSGEGATAFAPTRIASELEAAVTAAEAAGFDLPCALRIPCYAALLTLAGDAAVAAVTDPADCPVTAAVAARCYYVRAAALPAPRACRTRVPRSVPASAARGCCTREVPANECSGDVTDALRWCHALSARSCRRLQPPARLLVPGR
jgi:hypothetical protein